MNNYIEEINQIKEKILSCDAVIIGAGAGLSTSAGLYYSGERFEENFKDFIEEYNLTDMYSSAFRFFSFENPTRRWAYWSRHVKLNRYDKLDSDTYKNLLDLVKDKNYFVLTTNADHLFIRNGFDKERIFYTQGDYGLFQCSKACHNKTYDNHDIIMKMCKKQKNMDIPKELIPYCPKCGSYMDMNLRADDRFVEDDGWNEACNRYEKFINDNKDKNIVYLELGVGYNTPGIIKYPFMRYTYQNKKATYININYNQASTIDEIKDRSILINNDIDEVLKFIKNN